MLIPAKPDNEKERLDALRAFDILDTPPEERFDRLTRMAKRLFNVPVATVSLVDADRQWFKSVDGLSSRQTSRDYSFCGHAILGEDLFIVPDALADKRFHDNPLVTAAPGIRFYAGCPLTVSNGLRLGSICIMDFKPRQLNVEEQEILRDLGKMAEREIITFELAIKDDLTKMANRRGFEAIAGQALRVCKRMDKPTWLVFFDLNNFKHINDQYGHAEGDRALMTFASVLQGVLRGSDVVGRIGGDEFVALLIDISSGQVTEIMLRLRQALETARQAQGAAYDIQFSVGQIQYDYQRHASIEQLVLDADKAMYADKRAHRQHHRPIEQNPMLQ